MGADIPQETMEMGEAVDKMSRLREGNHREMSERQGERNKQKEMDEPERCTGGSRERKVVCVCVCVL